MINALRHLRLNHGLEGKADLQEAFVINALRHLRLNHRNRRILGSINTKSDQRLTASKVKSQVPKKSLMMIFSEVINALRHLRLNHIVSLWEPQKLTPVINALRHLRLNHKLLHAENQRPEYVINALRHLRLNHLPIATAAMVRKCDQRLTASKVKSLFLNSEVSIELKSDQRLTASKVKSPMGVMFRIRGLFRDQRLTASKVKSQLLE